MQIINNIFFFKNITRFITYMRSGLDESASEFVYASNKNLYVNQICIFGSCDVNLGEG